MLNGLDQLSRKLSGHVLTAADSGYDQARRVYNGMIDKRPAAIIMCSSVSDVRETLLFAAAESASALREADTTSTRSAR